MENEICPNCNYDLTSRAEGEACERCGSIDIQDIVTCIHCGNRFDGKVDVNPDQPEIAYNDPVSHGICPFCNKRWNK